MLIGITGARGFLGAPLARRCIEAGHTTVPLPREIGLLPEVDVVVHLAGESIAGLWTPRKRAAILESRVEGTRRLVERMRTVRHRPRVFICASAAGYYGHRPGEALDEDSPPGRGFRSEVCLEWEAEARRAEELGIRTVTLRLATVLDPAGGFLGAMLPLLRTGLCFVLGRTSDRFSWIGREDALRLVELCIADDSIRGPLNASAPRAATQKEFAHALAAAAGRHVLGRLPRRLLRLTLGEFARAFIDHQDVRPAKALQRGFRFRHPDLPGLFRALGLQSSETGRRHALA